MSLILRTSTENWITARAFTSDKGAWFAIFLWTKSSPGFRPTTSFAGTLESEQPIHKYSGVWTSLSLLKKSGSFYKLVSDHISLFFMIISKLSIIVSLDLTVGISWNDTLVLNLSLFGNKTMLSSSLLISFLMISICNIALQMSSG